MTYNLHYFRSHQTVQWTLVSCGWGGVILEETMLYSGWKYVFIVKRIHPALSEANVFIVYVFDYCFCHRVIVESFVDGTFE